MWKFKGREERFEMRFIELEHRDVFHLFHSGFQVDVVKFTIGPPPLWVSDQVVFLSWQFGCEMEISIMLFPCVRIVIIIFQYFNKVMQEETELEGQIKEIKTFVGVPRFLLSYRKLRSKSSMKLMIVSYVWKQYLVN